MMSGHRIFWKYMYVACPGSGVHTATQGSGGHEKNKTKNQGKSMNKRKLFIGNLHYSVTEGQLRKLLVQYGDVTSIKLMEGKGYAFVEFGSEQQAMNIRQTLSESVFEGRKLLIDGVPGRRKTGPDKKRTTPDSHRTRPGKIPGREPEPAVHHLEAVERPHDPEKKKSAPVSSRKTIKPSSPGKGMKKTGNHSVQGEKPSRSRPGDEKKSEGPDRRQRSDRPGEGRGSGEKRLQKPGSRDQGDTRRKIKTPVKNPGPYQGSKKHGSGRSGEETGSGTDDSPDSGMKEYLRHWATLAGKKEQ
jgi:RNA recognition motif-containing protein